MNRDGEIRPIRASAHSVSIDNRERISITGVSDVESFNDVEVVLSTSQGNLVVTGEGLHISRLNLDEGQLIIAGLVCSVEYERAEAVRQSLFTRMFR